MVVHELTLRSKVAHLSSDGMATSSRPSQRPFLYAACTVCAVRPAHQANARHGTETLDASRAHARRARLRRVHDAAHDDQIAGSAQALALGIKLHQAGQVLHAVQTCHGEQHRLVAVLPRSARSVREHGLARAPSCACPPMQAALQRMQALTHKHGAQANTKPGRSSNVVPPSLGRLALRA